VVGVGSALVQGLLVRRIVPALGERRAALTGYALSCCAYIAFGFAGQAWILFIALALQAVGAISGPAVQSMFSARAGADQQGRTQGALSSVQGLTAIMAPLVAGWAFSTFAAASAPVRIVGAPFLIAAAAYLLAFASVASIRPAEACAPGRTSPAASPEARLGSGRSGP
jgi:DHA1 family tetracycline resistance protein-like MFS transporter